MIDAGPVLSDRVVTVRQLRDTDGDAVLAHLSTDPTIAQWTRIAWPYTRSHLENFLGLVKHWHAAGTDFAGAIIDVASGELVGCCGLHRIGVRCEPRSSFLGDEIGYWVAAEARGHGVATRALRLMSRYGLVDLGRPKLNLQTKVGNTRSAVVARNVGYRFVERVLASDVDDDGDDHDRFELTRADLEPVGFPASGE